MIWKSLVQFCAFKICKYDWRIYLCFPWVWPDASLNLRLLAFCLLLFVKFQKNLTFLCNSLIVYCSYPYCFVFMCQKLLRHSWRVLKKILNHDICKFFVFALLPHHIFLHLIGCLNPMIKYDWLAEISTLMWLIERRCDFSTNRKWWKLEN